MKQKYDKHPSYAMMSISRGQSSRMQALFGSSIKHSNTITLKISPAYSQRKLNCDRYYSDSIPYIEVEMSQAQFAQAITSLNIGEGTPVTLKKLNGEFVETCPFEDKQKQFNKEMFQELNDVITQLSDMSKEAEEILNTKRTLTKTDKEKILGVFGKVIRTLKSNMPFIFSQFGRQMDKTVTEAKAEVEAHIRTRIEDLALRGARLHNSERLSELPPIEKYILQSEESEHENK